MKQQKLFFAGKGARRYPYSRIRAVVGRRLGIEFEKI